MRVIVFAILSCVAVLVQARPYSDAQGPFGVGLRVVHQYDYGRSFLDATDPNTGLATTAERARPVQTVVWYPAVKQGTPLTYGDYMHLYPTDVTFDTSAAEQKRLFTQYANQRAAGRSTEFVDKILAETMWAVRDAKALDGKFPVVVYAPSFNARNLECADICEFLASHGYIVLSSPSVGPRQAAMSSDSEGVNAQAGDIGFLIRYAHTLAQADTHNIAVLGYSWGGAANMVAAAYDNRIKALVSWDGSFRGNPDLIAAIPYVKAEGITIPLLYVATTAPSPEQFSESGMSPANNFLVGMKYSDRIIANMRPLQHWGLSSYFMRYAQDKYYSDYSAEEVLQAHQWAVRYTFQFLNAHLKGDAAARAFLANTPEKNGVPAHTIILDRRPAAGMPSTRASMAVELAKQGFDKAPSIYQTLRKANPKFELRENEVNSWGLNLLRAGKSKEALELFKLNTTLFPQSSNVYDSLAEGYENLGDKTRAVENYRHALELDPKADHAAKRIKALEAS